MQSGLFCFNSLGWCISKKRGICVFLLLPCFIEIPLFYANSVDPDQTPHSAASDLDLHCLQMSLLWDAGLKWVNSSPLKHAL